MGTPSTKELRLERDETVSEQSREAFGLSNHPVVVVAVMCRAVFGEQMRRGLILDSVSVPRLPTDEHRRFQDSGPMPSALRPPPPPSASQA